MYSSAAALQLRESKQRWGDVCRPVADPPSSKKNKCERRTERKLERMSHVGAHPCPLHVLTAFLLRDIVRDLTETSAQKNCHVEIFQISMHDICGEI